MCVCVLGIYLNNSTHTHSLVSFPYSSPSNRSLPTPLRAVRFEFLRKTGRPTTLQVYYNMTPPSEFVELGPTRIFNNLYSTAAVTLFLVYILSSRFGFDH